MAEDRSRYVAQSANQFQTQQAALLDDGSVVTELRRRVASGDLQTLSVKSSPELLLVTFRKDGITQVLVNEGETPPIEPPPIDPPPIDPPPIDPPPSINPWTYTGPGISVNPGNFRGNYDTVATGTILILEDGDYEPMNLDRQGITLIARNYLGARVISHGVVQPGAHEPDPVINVSGRGHWLCGLDVFHVGVNRHSSIVVAQGNQPDPHETPLGEGIKVKAPQTRVTACYCHDNKSGLSHFASAGDDLIVEATILMNNGWTTPAMPQGQGYYCQGGDILFHGCVLGGNFRDRKMNCEFYGTTAAYFRKLTTRSCYFHAGQAYCGSNASMEDVTAIGNFYNGLGPVFGAPGSVGPGHHKRFIIESNIFQGPDDWTALATIWNIAGGSFAENRFTKPGSKTVLQFQGCPGLRIGRNEFNGSLNIEGDSTPEIIAKAGNVATTWAPELETPYGTFRMRRGATSRLARNIFKPTVPFNPGRTAPTGIQADQIQALQDAFLKGLEEVTFDFQ